MANTSQKMRLRSAILATLNKYRNNPTVDNAQIKEDTEALETIEDKEYLCKLLLKEIAGEDTILANICSLFAIELISNEIFEKQAFTILKDKKISDERKFYVISIMKQKGIESSDYNEKNQSNVYFVGCYGRRYYRIINMVRFCLSKKIRTI